MTNNDILRRLRYALDIKDPTMIEIFKLSEYEISPDNLTAFLKKEEDKGYVECSHEVMGLFLDGLIIQKRGKREMAPGRVEKRNSVLTNNEILKKLRIALKFREDEMLSTLKLGGKTLSKSELSALFRKEGQRHYKECGDQILRNFLKGLTMRFRDL
ncbi:MAG: YehS family protein [Candidatus Anammoxibacter sp.]